MTKEAQDAIDAAKRDAAERIARIEREEAAKDSLPVRPDSAYSFAPGELRVTYRGGAPSYTGKGLPLAQVPALLAALPPLMRSHRRDGCLSIQPDGWPTRYADAPEEYRSAVGVTIEGGKGFGPTIAVEWHAEAAGNRVTVSAEVGSYLKGIRVTREGETYNRRGEVVNPGRVVAAPIEGARLVKWASGSPGSYRVSWFWPTLDAFLSWVAAIEV